MNRLKACKVISSSLLILFSLLAATNSALSAQAQYSSKDFSHWLDAARIANATYQSEDNLKETLASQGYEVELIQQIEGYSVGFVLATNHTSKQQLIAVRGTSNIENVLVDAAFVLVPDKLSGIDIHQGFLLSARDIYQAVSSSLKPGYQIRTIGHSLGGAAAVILAMMLDAQGYDITEVITFGQPKVTNISGSRQFKHLNVTRLVTLKDMVPLVPPLDPLELMNLSIFWHQGTEIILYDNQQYSVLQGTDSMMRARDFLNDIPGEKHVNSHFMSTYIKNLENKLDLAEQVKYKSDFKLTDWFGNTKKAQ